MALRLVRAGSRERWRAWLERNHDRCSEAWLVFPKRHTGKPRVSYDEAVEEALCFGWIDSVAKTLDHDHSMQRFTPRRDLRKWSALNLERFRRLEAQGRMTDAGRAKLPADVTPPPPRIQSGDPVPPFIASALAKHPEARRFFEGLAPGYRRDYVRYVMEAKREETRARRVEEAIRRLREGQKRVQDRPVQNGIAPDLDRA